MYGPCTCGGAQNRYSMCPPCKLWIANRACWFDGGRWRDADQEPMPTPDPPVTT